MKAYEVAWKHLSDVSIIVVASSAGKARYRGYQECVDAYSEARLIEMTAKRAPAYDELIEGDLHDGSLLFQVDVGGFGPDYVEYWGAPVRML